MAKEPKHVLLVSDHEAFRQALAKVMSQEEDLEVAWQAASIAETRGIHLDGIDVVVVDPLLPDGDGLELIREMSVANPDATALVLSHELDEAAYYRALGVGAADVLFTMTASMEEIINAVRRAPVGKRGRGDHG
jgi:two-component system, NarL family, response regulator DevR